MRPRRLNDREIEATLRRLLENGPIGQSCVLGDHIVASLDDESIELALWAMDEGHHCFLTPGLYDQVFIRMARRQC